MNNFEGCYTAIITPFKNGEVDWTAFEALIEEQIEGNVDGIVAVGTTGESPTLNMLEHEQVIEFVINKVNKRCLVVAGTGANSTAEAIRLTKHAAEAGADGTLQVTPYYNKPTQEGLYQHFKAIAECSELPIILYNVPGRSAQEISIDTVSRLSKLETVVAVKEAAGSVDRVSQILHACDITVLSGDDALVLPMMSVGAKGVISVLSNVLPTEISALVHSALRGEWTEARVKHYSLYPLMTAMFIETNPTPVKTTLALMGKVDEEFRLPLCKMEEGNRKKLVDILIKSGISL